MAPLTLRHLTLQPTPLANVSDSDDSAFEQALVKEGTELLSHEGWTERKSWHDGVVETFVLPQGTVTYEPAAGGGQPGPSPTGNSGEEGILWHKRVSRFKASEHGKFDVWFKALGENHIEQEQEYVDNLVDVVDVGKGEGKKGCYLKLYKLPFGATDRSFMCHAITISPKSPSDQDDKKQSDKKSNKSDPGSDGDDGSRQFLVFSLPITTPTEPKEGQKYVRGTQATVECVRELEGGEIEWSCASLSTPGGNIPVRLGESKMAQSLADAVPTILTWMAKAYPPGASHIKSGTYTADSPATAQRPAKLRQTIKGQNPGGGMGRMPAGRFTLEMFQREVHLRDY